MGVRSLTAPSVESLDFGWWANNGPTGGYLLSLALAAADDDQRPAEVVRYVALQLLGLPVVGAFAYEPARLPSRPGTGVTSVDFVQRRLFATAQVISGAADGASRRTSSGVSPSNGQTLQRKNSPYGPCASQDSLLSSLVVGRGITVMGFEG